MTSRNLGSWVLPLYSCIFNDTSHSTITFSNHACKCRKLYTAVTLSSHSQPKSGVIISLFMLRLQAHLQDSNFLITTSAFLALNTSLLLAGVELVIIPLTSRELQPLLKGTPKVAYDKTMTPRTIFIFTISFVSEIIFAKDLQVKWISVRINHVLPHCNVSFL